MGIWMAFCGLAGLSLGIAMNNKEESMIKNSSDNGFFWHDSWSILLFSVLAITLGIDFAAWNRPDMYPPFIFQEVNTRSRATAFIINGFILFLLSWYLDRHRTVVRKRLSSLLRWLMPAHILGAIIELEKSLTFRESWLWLAALVVSAGGFCFSSIFRQWRPFLVSGLIAMAFAYFRITVRIKEYFGTENHFIYYFVLATIAAGLIILFSASKLPAGNKDKYK